MKVLKQRFEGTGRKVLGIGKRELCAVIMFAEYIILYIRNLSALENSQA